jgi:hypothetical protein
MVIDMKVVAFFESKCGACNRTFEWPLLPDMSYGELILHGGHRTIHVHVELIENSAYEYIRQSFRLKDVDILQELLANAADRIDNQSLTTVGICPYCGSQKLNIWSDKRLRLSEIHEATFEVFLSYSPTERVLRMDKWYECLASRGG